MSQKKLLRYSHSTLNTILQCPAKLYFKKLARDGVIEEDIAPPLIYGSGGHAGIEGAILNGEEPISVYKQYMEENLYSKLPAIQKKLTEEENQKLKEQMEEREEISLLGLNNFKRVHYPKVMKALEGHDPKDCVEVSMEVPFRKGTLVGKADLLVPGAFVVDWKFGKPHKIDRDGKIPTLASDAQKAIYYYLKKKLDINVSGHFKYVYLQGQPTRQTEERDEQGEIVRYKSGPRKGEPKLVWDRENGVKYDFNFDQTEEEVEQIFNEHVNPLAEVLESGLLWKNPGYNMMNCTGCQYRTACQKQKIPLPERADYALFQGDKEEKIHE